jgi:hypothetical protein
VSFIPLPRIYISILQTPEFEHGEARRRTARHRLNPPMTMLKTWNDCSVYQTHSDVIRRWLGSHMPDNDYYQWYISSLRVKMVPKIRMFHRKDSIRSAHVSYLEGYGSTLL